ncbi:hypothetical protein CHU98_g9102 [Xylaria longipes]|nr:hypothetical protein CHU98_g9102 [Xylaria longipes]
MNQSVYWPTIAANASKYILGCLQCARFNPGKPMAPDLPITIYEPLQIVVADFIGPFPLSNRKNRYIYCIVDYFSRYGWCYPTTDCTAKTAIAKTRRWINKICSAPIALYADPGSAFTSQDFADQMEKESIEVINAPSASHQSVGLVEVFNKITQIVLNKITVYSMNQVNDPNHKDNKDWDAEIPKLTRHLNSRYMKAIGYSPSEILHGYTSRDAFEREYPPSQSIELRTALMTREFTLPDEETWANLAVQRVGCLHYCLEDVRQLHENARSRRQALHGHKSGLRLGDLVFVHQAGKQPKLGVKWRGPFRLALWTGRKSYILENLDRSKAAKGLDFHKNSLKLFIPRSGYLQTEEDRQYVLPLKQPIRRPR